MFRFFADMPFRQKLIAFVAMLFLGTACIQFMFTANFFQGVILEKSQTLLHEVVAQIGVRIDTEISTRNQMIEQITLNPTIAYYIGDIIEQKINKEVITPKIMREVLRLKPGSYYNVEDFYIFPKRGDPVNCYYSTALSEADPYSRLILNRLIADMSSLDMSIIWDDFYLEQEYISAYAPIADRSRPTALARIRFSKVFLAKIVDDIHLSNDNVIAIIDQTGNIIYSNNQDYIGRTQQSLSKRENYVVSAPLSHNNWMVVGAIPHATVLMETFKWNAIFLMIYVLTFLAALSAVGIYFKYLLKPLSAIVDGMRQLQYGNLDVSLKKSSSDEFGFIIDSFNDMAGRLKSQLLQTYSYQEAVHRATISNIESKLNPHFLYNTLDSIYWMLVVKDASEEADMVSRLSNMLRYSISSSDELVPVWKDFAQLENYIALHQYRFESRLQYSIELEDDIRQIRIPKLLLQPVLENSIKHGFSKLSSVGKIAIEGYQQGEDVFFVLRDNGVGMPPEKLKHVLTAGLGLQLTQQRIQYIYGESYGITVQSEPCAGTTITVRIHRHARLGLGQILGGRAPGQGGETGYEDTHGG